MKNVTSKVLAVLALVVLMGCDDTYISSVPDSYVNLKLDLASTYPTFKNNPFQYLLFEKKNYVTDGIGYSGIIVFCGWEGYYAFDMCCPYEHKKAIKVYPNTIGQATCDSCKTVYDISYGVGNPVSGPAKEALRHYKVTQSGDILYVSR